MTVAHALTVVEDRHSLERPASAIEIRAQVNLIQEVLKAVMKDGTHFGTIPGTPRPTLYKAGAEKILSTFRIAIEPVVEDLSTSDEARYRVTTRATHQGTGAFLGAGVGECSSNEEKYAWRSALCHEEYLATPEDRRRSAWKRKGGHVGQIEQVRTNHADLANTVLKMAKKRSQIDACLTVTAASDVFAQDLEDLPDEVREAVAPEAPPQAPRRTETTAPGRAASGGDARVISEPQRKRFYAIYSQAKWRSEDVAAWLLETYGISDDREIPRSKYDEICEAVAGGIS